MSAASFILCTSGRFFGFLARCHMGTDSCTHGGTPVSVNRQEECIHLFFPTSLSD